MAYNYCSIQLSGTAHCNIAVEQSTIVLTAAVHVCSSVAVLRCNVISAMCVSVPCDVVCVCCVTVVAMYSLQL
jgi:hypothetical protein